MPSENYNSLLDPFVRTIYAEEFNRGQDMVPFFYNVERSMTYQEKLSSMLSLGAWPEFNGTLQYEDLLVGYEKTITHKVYAKGLEISRETVDDGLWNKVKLDTMGFARSAYATRQAHAAAPFNDAFAGSTYTTPDGLSLCNSAHTSKGSSGNQSNTFTLALSGDNVETVRVAMMNFTDDNGNPANIVPDTLLVSPTKIKLAREICDSELKSNTANNDINVYKGGINAMMWNRLTAPNAWFLIDSTMMRMFNLWFERVPSEFNMSDKFDEFKYLYSGYMRHSYGTGDWRWIAGSNPS